MQKDEIIENTHRIEWIDTAKGIAIFLVVFGHCVEYLFCKDSCLSKVVHMMIYSFHMPLFFLLSGLVFDCNRYLGFQSFFKKKFRSLIIPSYAFIVIWGLVNVILQNDIQINAKSVIRTLLQFRVDVIRNYWFLTTLFIAEIILYLIHKLLNKYSLIICLIISLIGVSYIYYLAKPLPFSLDNALMVLIFLQVGYSLKNKKSNRIIIILFFIVWAFGLGINYCFFEAKSISVAYGNLLNPLLFYILSFSGSFVMMFIAQRIDNKHIISEYGKNSLTIYLLNGIIINIIEKIVGIMGVTISNQVLSLLICFLLSILIVQFSDILSGIIKRHFQFLLGGKC